MKWTKFLLFYFLLFFHHLTWGQYSRHLSGFVNDAQTGEALVGVKISLLRWGSVVYSNQFGYFNISVPVGEIQLEMDYSNYKPIVLDLNLQKDSSIQVELTEQFGNFGINNFRRKSLNDIECPIPGKTDLPIELIEAFPYFLAESDLIKGLQMIPGINAGNEGFSNLYIRGGSADQNLLLLDGVPVYNNNHVFGFFSIYNTEAVNDVQIYKGGMPAKFGGRLSSVIDITMDEGNTNELSGDFTLGLMAGRLLLSGPIGSKNKTTYNLSFRRTLIDRLFDAEGDNSEAITNFYDLNGKVKHRINKRNQLFASIYSGRDKFEFSDVVYDSSSNKDFKSTFSLKWGNLTSNLRWNHIFNNKMFLNLSLAYTQYQSKFSYTNEQTGSARNLQYSNIERTNGIRDFMINSDWEYNLSNRHKLNFGSNFIRHNFNTGKEKTENKNISSSSDGTREIGNINGTKTYELALFAEDNFRINKYQFLQWGFRLNNYLHGDGSYVPLFSPRVNYRLILNQKLAFKSAYTRTHQVTNLMTNRGTGGLPTNFWSPSIGNIKPQSAHQFTIGFANKISASLELNIDAYYKMMQNVIEVTNPNFFDVNEDWKSFVKQGQGNATGIELMIQKKQGWLTGWFGYTHSYTNRTFETLNSGNTFPFSFDQRHMFKIYTNWKLDDYLTLLGAITAGSSPRFTMPSNKYYDLEGNLVLDYGEVNNFQPNPYFRLDIGWIRTSYGVGVSQEMKVTVYNFLATKNPMSVFAEQSQNQQQAFKAMKYNNPRFVPGITYKMIF